MKNRKALSSVVGTVFSIIALVTVITYVTYSMNTLQQFNQEVMVKNTEIIDQGKEEFSIVKSTIPNNKFNITVQNTGELPINITRIWISNKTDPSWGTAKYDVNIPVSPGKVATNIGQNIALTALSTKSYEIKLATERGNSEEALINSPSQEPLYLQLHALPEAVSTEFTTTILLTVTNNMSNNNMLLNVAPDLTDGTNSISVTPTCASTCSATWKSGPTPSSYPSLKYGDTATFKWIYEVEGSPGDTITFTASLNNGISSNTATAVVTITDVVSAIEAGSALTTKGLTTSTLGNDVLLFHLETDRTPSARYQMYSGNADGGNNGLKIDLDTANRRFFTNNGTDTINTPTGNWVASLRLQSESMPASLVGDGESMIFHFDDAGAAPDNSEGSSTRDLEGCGLSTFLKTITVGADDAEEVLSDGSMQLTSGDFDMPYDGSTLQRDGLRFQGVTIPQGSIIQSAFIQFKADAAHSTSVTVKILGENADNAAAFTTATNDITNRADTTASVTWTIPNWVTVGDILAAQKTPDLKTIIQEIVNRGGWASGNSLVIQIENSGTSSGNRREAETVEGDPPAAALTITYSPSSGTGGSPTWQSTAGPHSSGAFQFDGVNDCFRSVNNVSSGDNNNITTPPDTTALWFKTSEVVGATEQHLVSWGGGGTCPSCDYYKIALEANTGKVVFQFNLNTGGSETTTCKSTNRYDNSQWYHVVAVRESTNDNCSLYITRLDGTDAESTITSSVNNPSNSVDSDGRWYVGSNEAENGNFFKGYIDDVIHWNGKALSSTEANDLSHVNYGTAAHKINLYLDKTDKDGVFVQNLVTDLNVPVRFYDPRGGNDNNDPTYYVFNRTLTPGAVTLTPGQRLNFSINWVSSTSTWVALQLDMKIDDQDMNPLTSFIQTTMPDVPFPSYYVYDKSNRLVVYVYNVGPYGSWLVYQGTRAVFDSPTSGTSYAALICSVNSTQLDPCDTGGVNTNWRVNEDRDSIFIPVNNVAQVFFFQVQDRPDRDVGGGTLIPAGEYDMTVFIDGYDEKGQKFLRNLSLGRVRVQD